MTELRCLGVIGDVHAEHERLLSALVHLENLGVDAIVCTGDIVDGRGSPDRCIELLQDANVLTVRGNHDRWLLEHKARHVPEAHLHSDISESSVNYLQSLPSQIEVSTMLGELLLCHGIADDDLKKIWPGTERMEVERSKTLDDIISTGNFRYVINGHMHFRTLIHFPELTLINAGTLKGEHWPGFSIINFETEIISAYEFQDDQTQLVKEHKLRDSNHTVWENTQAFSGGWDPVRLF